jgi:hypothetical protein
MTGTDALISLILALAKAEVPYMIVGSYSSNFYCAILSQGRTHNRLKFSVRKQDAQTRPRVGAGYLFSPFAETPKLRKRQLSISYEN